MAVAAFPESIELVENGVDEVEFFGPDAKLEVAFSVGFGAQTGAGEVGATEVHGAAIDNDGFGVKAGATADGQAGGELAFEFNQCRRRRGTCMEQADFHASLGKSAE